MNAPTQTRAAAYLTDGCHRVATRREAIALAGMYPMPRDGESIVVASNTLSGNRLHLHCIGTAYYLNATCPVSFWPGCFGVRS